MEEQKKSPEEQDKKLPENSQAENKEDNTNKKEKGGLHNNALHAASMGRPATAQVKRDNGRRLADTGTNIIYEGPTAPGGGGSVGSGYASGNSAIEANITTDSDFDRARVEKDNSDQADDNTDAGHQGKKGTSDRNAKHDEERDII